MSDEIHELDLAVGSIFTTRPDEDRELYEEERAWLSEVQDLLREEGVEIDLLSRPGAEIWEGSIRRFADLYQLRLIAAYLEQNRDIAELTADTDIDLPDEPDPLLAAIWEEETTTNFAHLLNHQAQDGYYLPVDFPQPIWLEFDEDEYEDEDDEEELEERVVSFGSSVGLQRELVDLAGRMTAAGVSTSHPAFVCLNTMLAAAKASVDNELPIIVW
jgi:hypothetical protein